jgi:hypothetical protein
MESMVSPKWEIRGTFFIHPVDVLADETVCRFIVTAIPHIFDSVILTTLSFGLLGSHIAAFCYGVIDGIFAWP